jgi:hypothetical protein
MLHALSISYSLTWSFYLAKSTNYEAHHYDKFSNILLFHPSSVQVFTTASYSQMSLVCVLPVMSDVTISAEEIINIPLHFYMIS